MTRRQSVVAEPITGHPPAADAVQLDGVSITFPRRAEAVLGQVDLRVGPGEQVLLLGASGSGKSTVLQAVAGVVPHSVTAEVSGTITVAGTPTTETSVVELSRQVGVLPQDPSAAVCLPDVAQELALPLENRAVDPDAIDPAIDAALDLAGARHLRHRATAELSGGESQRVALAAAVLNEPAVLLLDEPTSMLDPDGVAGVRDVLRTVMGEHDPAVLLVEHRLDELAGTDGQKGLPARAVVLSEQGRVLADGPTGEVLQAQSRHLHATGNWLPLESELHALTGVAGGLAAAANTELLERLAAAGAQTAGNADEGAVTAAVSGGAAPEGASGPARVARAGAPLQTSPAPVVRARNLTITRERQPSSRRRRKARRSPPIVPLLSDINLDIGAGEVVALVGPNGVGKTTLLLTLAGLLAPAAGTVAGSRPGMVFQNAEHQFLAHTVRAEVAHELSQRAQETVTAQLRAHRLEHLGDQNPFRLSGGEKRRVSLAAMLAHDRSCLLADEPTLGLDRRDTIATVSALRAAAQGGRCVVFSSHDLRTVLTLADRVMVLAEGAVIADGPAVTVLRDPQVRERGGLRPGPLVSWLLENVEEAGAVQRVLRELDAAVTPPVQASTAGHGP